MAAVAEEDGRPEMVQELSSENDEDIEILEAEEIAAQRAAEAAAARWRILKARAGSSRSNASAASRSSRRPSSYMRTSRSAHKLRLTPYQFRYRHLRPSRSDQQRQRSSRSWTSMQQREFHHSKFRRTFRTSTSEHVRKLGTCKWPASSGVPEIVTFKNVEIENQFIKFNQTMVQECELLSP